MRKVLLGGLKMPSQEHLEKLAERLEKITEAIFEIQAGPVAVVTDEQLASDVAQKLGKEVRGDEPWSDWLRLVKEAAASLDKEPTGIMPGGFTSRRRRQIVGELLGTEPHKATAKEAALSILDPSRDENLSASRREEIVAELADNTGRSQGRR
jgi:hypothetical protein